MLMIYHLKVANQNNVLSILYNIQLVILYIDSKFAFSLSTKRLIGLVKKRKHICADATYKLIWQGYFILLFYYFFDWF